MTDKAGKKSPHSGIWDNFIWGMKQMIKSKGSGFVGICLFYVLVSVAEPFVSMAFPSAAIAILSRDEGIVKTIGLILGYVLFLRILSYFLAVLNSKTQMGFFLNRIDVGSILNKHIVNMNYEDFESHEGRQRLGAANACIYRGNDTGYEMFMRMFPEAAKNIIGFIIYSFIMVKIHWGIFAYMAVSSILLGLLNTRLDTYYTKKDSEIMELYGKSDKLNRETLDSANGKDIRLYHTQKWLIAGMNKIVNRYEAFYRGISKIIGSNGIAETVVNVLRDMIVYLFLIQQVSKGYLSVAQLLLYVGAVSGYSLWISKLLTAIQKIYSNKKYMVDFRDFLDYGSMEQGNQIPEEIAGKAHTITFDHVSFQYEGTETPAVEDLCFTITQGEKIALVGANGAGKSTLIKLLCGLYTPTAGTIYLDGIDVATLNKQSYFKEFAVVFQDVFAFAFSLAENVSCQDVKDTDLRKVAQCIEQAGLSERVKEAKEGLNHPVTRNLEEDGIELSGGQMQKLMLARALYKDGAVLVLDEPTAALDPIAESEMYQTYSSLAKDKTSIFISHRLSSTQFCDRICFMEHGKIVESGSHQELISKNGAYANMFHVQAQYYQEAAYE